MGSAFKRDTHSDDRINNDKDKICNGSHNSGYDTADSRDNRALTMVFVNINYLWRIERHLPLLWMESVIRTSFVRVGQWGSVANCFCWGLGGPLRRWRSLPFMLPSAERQGGAGRKGGANDGDDVWGVDSCMTAIRP